MLKILYNFIFLLIFLFNLMCFFKKCKGEYIKAVTEEKRTLADLKEIKIQSHKNDVIQK